MNVNDAFPSTYLRASDLNGAPLVLTISGCQVEMVGDDQKPILFFQEPDQKPLALNKTNANTIAAIYGPETNGWMGRQIELYPTTTDFKGTITPCIRLRQPGMVQQAVQPGQPVPPRSEAPIVQPAPYAPPDTQGPLGPNPPPHGGNGQPTP